MKPSAFPNTITSSVSPVFLEGISHSVRDKLWHHIQSDRLHPKRKNGWPGITDPASLDAYIASCDVSYPTSAEFAYIIVDSAGTLTGTFHIFSVDWTEETAEIGYGIHHRHEGKGLVAAAIGVAEETLKYMGFKSLRITCPEWNTRSWAVAQRCGYELEKIVHDSQECSGCDECTRHYKKRLS